MMCHLYSQGLLHKRESSGSDGTSAAKRKRGAVEKRERQEVKKLTAKSIVAIIFLKILQQILATTESSSKEQDTSGSVLMGDAESISVTSRVCMQLHLPHEALVFKLSHHVEMLTFRLHQ